MEGIIGHYFTGSYTPTAKHNRNTERRSGKIRILDKIRLDKGQFESNPPHCEDYYVVADEQKGVWIIAATELTNMQWV